MAPSKAVKAPSKAAPKVGQVKLNDLKRYLEPAADRLETGKKDTWYSGFNPLTDALPPVSMVAMKKDAPANRINGYSYRSSLSSDVFKATKGVCPVLSRFNPYKGEAYIEDLNAIQMNFTRATFDARFGMNRENELFGYDINNEAFYDRYADLDLEQRNALKCVLIDTAFLHDMCSDLFSKLRVKRGMKFVSVRKLYRYWSNKNPLQNGKMTTGSPVDALKGVPIRDMMMAIFVHFFRAADMINELEPIRAFERETELFLNEEKMLQVMRKNALTKQMEGFKIESHMHNIMARGVAIPTFLYNNIADDLIRVCRAVASALHQAETVNRQLKTAALMFKLQLHHLDRHRLPPDVQSHPLYGRIIEDITLFKIFMNDITTEGVTIPHEDQTRAACLDMVAEVLSPSQKRFNTVDLSVLSSAAGFYHYRIRAIDEVEAVTMWDSYDTARTHSGLDLEDVEAISDDESSHRHMTMKPRADWTSILTAADPETINFKIDQQTNNLLEDLLDLQRTDTLEKVFINYAREQILLDLTAHRLALTTSCQWAPILYHEGLTEKGKPEVDDPNDIFRDTTAKAISDVLRLRMARAEQGTIFYKVKQRTRDSLHMETPPTKEIWTKDPRVVIYSSDVDQQPSNNLIVPPTTFWKVNPASIYLRQLDERGGAGSGILTGINSAPKKITLTDIKTMNSAGQYVNNKEVTYKTNPQQLLFEHELPVYTLKQEVANHEAATNMYKHALQRSPEFVLYFLGKDKLEDLTDPQASAIITHNTMMMQATVEMLQAFSSKTSLSHVIRSIMNELIENEQILADYRRDFGRSEAVVALKFIGVIWVASYFQDLPVEWFTRFYKSLKDTNLMHALIRSDFGREL